MQYFSSFFQKKIHLSYSDFDTEPLFEDKFKTILGNKISYKDEGSGPVVFCIPPWPMSSTAFTPFINAMKGYFRIIAIDLPGWGGKSPRMNLDPTLENYAIIVEEFIKSFNFETFDMIGYSLGGMITEKLIERGNVCPNKAVFVSSAQSSERLNEKIHFASSAYNFIKKFHLPDTFVKNFMTFIVLRFIRDKWYFSRYIKSRLYILFQSEEEKADVKSIFEVLSSITKEKLFNDKNKLRCKALVIYGDEDEDFIIESCKEIAKFYSVSPIILTNCDHNHFFVDVNKSDQIIADFLNS